MPKDDFLTYAKVINAIFPTRVFTENVCETKYGSCYIEMPCENVTQKEKDEGLDYSLTLSVNGYNDVETTLTLDMSEMLFKSKDENNTDVCILPFMSLGRGDAIKTPNTWILGSIISKKYYQVFDLEDESGEIMIRMGAKNPTFQKKPDVPGGGPDDKPSKGVHKTEIIVIVLAVIIVIATLGLLYVCIKRKQKNDQSFVFENNQDYG